MIVQQDCQNAPIPTLHGILSMQPTSDGYRLYGLLPALYPEWLGDQSFTRTHHVRFPYVVGAMANGIASADMVIAASQAKLLAFFGAAGLGPERTETNLIKISDALKRSGNTFGSNLIHSPDNTELEKAMVDLYLRRGITRVSASAFMSLSPEIVRYAVNGLRETQQGRIERKNFIFAKISRPEVAVHFLEPAPHAVLDHLVNTNQISSEEARLAAHIPLATDITVESDSGGHTDNRPLGPLFSTISAMRDRLVAQHNYQETIRLGAAGGLGTPQAVASAFAMGAAFVLTGSVNQSATESGMSNIGRALLAKQDIADNAMAPAADMFELGVKVQVLKKGTMWAVRAQKLYELYRTYDAWEAIPEAQQQQVEKQLLRDSFANAWAGTRDFFQARDPKLAARGERDAKFRMALVFRWYLGMASRWAVTGVKDRDIDYQIWSGPAMGAFNAWVQGSFLEPPAQRNVVQIALNLLEGAATITRAHQLRSFGINVPADAFQFAPRPLSL